MYDGSIAAGEGPDLRQREAAEVVVHELEDGIEAILVAVALNL